MRLRGFLFGNLARCCETRRMEETSPWAPIRLPSGALLIVALRPCGRVGPWAEIDPEGEGGMDAAVRAIRGEPRRWGGVHGTFALAPSNVLARFGITPILVGGGLSVYDLHDPGVLPMARWALGRREGVILGHEAARAMSLDPLLPRTGGGDWWAAGSA